jgi:antitoxin component YwqK of YwqJK toxin-antitoxin module
VYVQAALDGQEWTNHGIELRWDHDRDGTQVVFESPYSMGQLNGTARVWRDGKLAFRREYQMDKQHGLSEGWYQNGQKQYESVYQLGKEVSGKSWREDGTQAN